MTHYLQDFIQRSYAFRHFYNYFVMDVHYVIRYTDCPAMLVETAFIDNVDDNALLVEREDDFARAIALDITDYVKAYAS